MQTERTQDLRWHSAGCKPLANASEELLDVITTTKRGADESKTSEVKRLSPQQFLAFSVPYYNLR